MFLFNFDIKTFNKYNVDVKIVKTSTVPSPYIGPMNEKNILGNTPKTPLASLWFHF